MTAIIIPFPGSKAKATAGEAIYRLYLESGHQAVSRELAQRLIAEFDAGGANFRRLVSALVR